MFGRSRPLIGTLQSNLLFGFDALQLQRVSQVLICPIIGCSIVPAYRLSRYQATWDLQSVPAERLAARLSANNQKCELCIPFSGDMIPHEACQ